MLHEQAFLAAMAAAGLRTMDRISADGRLHRIRIEGDGTGKRNGWYIFFPDGMPSGAFGSWKTGIKGLWCAKAQHDQSPAELTENKRRVEAARKAREAEDQAVKQAARQKAAAIWLALPIAPDSHPYLVKKGVKNYGLRIARDALVIPLCDKAGRLNSLQFIDTEGNKRGNSTHL